MAIRAVIEVLEDVRDAYNSENFDFDKWHGSMPFLFVEDVHKELITDPIIISRLFETLANCNRYLGLTKMDFRLQHLSMMSDTMAQISLLWEFFNTKNKAELILEIGHIMQKKDDGWKISVLLQPAWRKPFTSMKDTTRLSRPKQKERKT